VNNLELKREKVIDNFKNSPKFKILFICSGNIIRSPYAHLLFNHMIKNDKRLSTRLEIDSGAVKFRNSVISQETYIQLLRKGVSKDEILIFKPKHLRDFPEIIEVSDLILVMEKEHLKYIPSLKLDQSFLLLEFTDGLEEDVPDPYFDPPYERAYELINLSLQKLYEIFKRI